MAAINRNVVDTMTSELLYSLCTINNDVCTCRIDERPGARLDEMVDVHGYL